MDTLRQDIRYALRTLLKNPLFAAVAVLTLGLGIGINTTIFSVVNAILIRPMPHVETDRLVVLRETNTREGQDTELSYPNFADWRAESRSFEDMAAYYDRRFILSAPGGEPEEVEAEMVTPNLFALLGSRTAHGRLFRPEEGTPGADPVVLLAHVLWEQRFGSDPAAVGKTLMLNGVAHTIIGVMPPNFGFPDNQPLWVPFAHTPDPAERGARYLRVVGRLRPGVTVEAAQAELGAIAARLAAEHPETNALAGARVIPFNEHWVGHIRPVLLVMLGAVGFVLLIACANVANLMLTRAAGRQKEIAVRAALGAPRGRLVRQLLTESIVVGVLGGALGVLLAYQALGMLLATFPFTPPLWMVFDIDRNVLLFTLAISVGTGLVFGVLPALGATRSDLSTTLRDGGRGLSMGRSGNRLRSGLVVAELALATVLLAGAMLMIRSFFQLQDTSPGFDTQNVLTVRVNTGGERYDEASARQAFFASLVERTQALPGVEAAAVTSIVPLAGSSNTSAFRVEDRPVPPGEESSAEYRSISADYFQVLGTPLLLGRAPTLQEIETGAPVVVINRSFAERIWPGEEVVGKRIQMGGPWLTVVGVARDVRLRALDEQPTLQVYGPLSLRSPRAMTLLVRGTGDPAALTPAVRGVVRELDPGVAISSALVMEDVLQRSLWQQRLFGGLFTSFAAIALLLAATGVYGVIAFGVAQRTREMGIRLALGAGTGRLLRLIVGQGLVLAAIGIGLGMLASLGLMRLLASQLYGVSATDPVALGGTAALLLLAAIAASYLPARRATRADPMLALRAE